MNLRAVDIDRRSLAVVPIITFVGEPEWAEHDADIVRRAARNSDLARVRSICASGAAVKLRAVGQAAHVVGHVVGEGRTAGTSPHGNGDDALVGVGILTQIAADLLDAAGALLSGPNHYAGAALLRQIVEVEYLTWAFANQKRDAAAWLNSTHDDRRRMFTPAGLRSESEGLFLSTDYGHHCEQGGHPVPRAIPLLASSDPLHSQVLLVDLLVHSWRTTDNVATWIEGRDADLLLSQLRSVQNEFVSWGRADPLYAMAVKERPRATQAQQPQR